MAAIPYDKICHACRAVGAFKINDYTFMGIKYTRHKIAR